MYTKCAYVTEGSRACKFNLSISLNYGHSSCVLVDPDPMTGLSVKKHLLETEAIFIGYISYSSLHCPVDLYGTVLSSVVYYGLKESASPFDKIVGKQCLPKTTLKLF